MTLFLTTLETVNVDAVTTILSFYRFGGHVSPDVSLCG